MNNFGKIVAESWRKRGPKPFLTNHLIYKGYDDEGAYVGFSPVGEVLLMAGWKEDKIAEIDQLDHTESTKIAAELMEISHTHMAFIRMLNEINCGSNMHSEDNVYNALAYPDVFFGYGTKDLLEFWAGADSLDASSISFDEEWVSFNAFLKSVRKEYQNNRAVQMIGEAICDAEYKFVPTGDAGARAYNEFQLASIQVCLGDVLNEKIPPEKDVAKKFKLAIEAAQTAKKQAEAPKPIEESSETPSRLDRELAFQQEIAFFMSAPRRPSP